MSSPPTPIRKKREAEGGREEDLQPLRFTELQPLPFLPSTLSQSLPIPPPQPPKSWTTAKETEKSSPAPILAEDQHLFCSRRTHSPPDVTRSPGQWARGRGGSGRRRGGGSRRAPPPRRPGPRGGREGTVPYKPPAVQARPLAPAAPYQGRKGSPKRELGPAATSSLHPFLPLCPSTPSPSPSSDPYLP